MIIRLDYYDLINFWEFELCFSNVRQDTNSFIYSPSLGLLIALAIAIHNIPEEFAMAVPLLLTEKKKLLFRVCP
jgi:hypothetical protein